MDERIKFLASHLYFYLRMCNHNVSDVWLDELLKNTDDKLVSRIKKDYEEQELSLTPENFIIYSESIFTEEERRNKGITYTPVKIAKKMVELSINQLENINKKSFKVIDPAVGGGIFLVVAARLLSNKMNIPMNKLIEENLFGIDIVPDNIALSRIALTLLSLENDCELPTHFNLIEYDSFQISEEQLSEMFQTTKFDLVITNPPYIRSKNLTLDTKENLRENFKTVHGITDSYIPFFEVALNFLNPGKVATLITPNTFFTSLNGNKLRRFLIQEGQSIKLINFKDQQIFEGVSSYSAVTSIIKKDKESKRCKINYLMTSFLQSDFINNQGLKWKEVKQVESWRTLNDLELSVISKLENRFTTQLKDLKFKNGVATQRNNIYSFTVKKHCDKYYYFDKNQVEYKVEKNITRSFVTPNERVQPTKQRIIFPYKLNEKTQKNKVIPEKEMLEYYPLTYSYLMTYKNELDLRASDKRMPAWYAYGRSQGLNDFGHRLYLPYMAKRVHTLISKTPNEVFAAGYAIFDEDLEYLNILSNILESSLFNFYIATISKPYSKGYYSTAKNMIQYFSVPSKAWTKNNLKETLSEDDIFKLYNLSKREKKVVLEKVNSSE